MFRALHVVSNDGNTIYLTEAKSVGFVYICTILRVLLMCMWPT